MKVTVKQKEKEEINWNEVQLVVAENGQIVMVSEKQTQSYNEECFCGQDIKTGDYDHRWTKSEFKKFHGTLTIDQ